MKPGLYDIPEDEYHADPLANDGGSLSASGAGDLLWPGSPEIFNYKRTHPEPHKKAYDVGSATHAKLLGKGADVVEIPADLLSKNGAASTAEAKAFIAKQYDAGKIPLKAAEIAECDRYVDKVMAHPLAGPLFREVGLAEQSMFWQDQKTGIWRRARMDWLVGDYIVDFKTARGYGEPQEWSRSIRDHGYHRQDANYRDGVQALGLIKRPKFVFVIVGKDAPYPVSVVQLHADDQRLGRAEMDAACALYDKCSAANHWPGYADDHVETVAMPPYARSRAEDLYL